jgi:hypothetical protein
MEHRTISQLDVIAYFKAAPLEVLEQLQEELQRYIERREDNDNKVSVIQNVITSFNEGKKTFASAPLPGQGFHSNNDTVGTAQVPVHGSIYDRKEQQSAPVKPKMSIFAGAPLPGQIPKPNNVDSTAAPTKSASTTGTTSYLKEEPKETPDKVAKLMAFMAKSKGSNGNNNNEEVKVKPFEVEVEIAKEREPPTNDEPIVTPNGEVFDAELIFKYGDNFGDGLFSINDSKLRDIIQKKKDECTAENAHFPYGYGKDNDLLKIKGFKRAKAGEKLRIKIRLQPWSNQGRRGYTCYNH